MSLADLMREGSLRGAATATPATFATERSERAGTVARVAAVAVATAPEHEAANDHALDFDRWCWPHSSAMNTAEIDRFRARVLRFAGKGLLLADAETLADKLMIRDREEDDRRLCLECANLSGLRCSAWQRAGIDGPSISGDLVTTLQRCQGYAPWRGN